MKGKIQHTIYLVYNGSNGYRNCYSIKKSIVEMEQHVKLIIPHKNLEIKSKSTAKNVEAKKKK